MENNQRPDGPWRIEPETLEAALETEFAGRPALTPALKIGLKIYPGKMRNSKPPLDLPGLMK